MKGKSIKGKGLSALFRPFRSRRELAAFLRDSNGLFEFGMYGLDGGHAVAFDTRVGSFVFFDANSGIWVKNGAFSNQDGLYKFIYNYWEAIGYKQTYELGRRDMHQFG